MSLLARLWRADKGHVMRMRRLGAAVVASLLVAGTVGCSQAAQDGATPTPDEKNAKSVQRSEAALPDEPQIAIDWQNTVVDVEPTSRFREDPGGSDTAHVETLLALEEEPDGDTEDFLKGLEGVDVEIDGRLVRMKYSFDVEETDEDRYELEFQAPVEFAELDKNDDVSAIILLPRDASDYENAPGYGVRLMGFSEDTPEDDLEVLQADEAPGKRITIGLYERTDPPIGPIWGYIPL
jgi:hypothetical protein